MQAQGLDFASIRRALHARRSEAIGGAAQEEVLQINAALEQLDRGTYGFCMKCEARIEPARLRAVPHALTCVACAKV